ncbi:MAG TPA: HlyD family efflux transporter periplasmic adaptor subunit [Candidatus Saccharimonadia bacterium]|nr:HlyD family efflux transporter periplasmic adaptor subunit [Candidatus Saccharimonadia bacterium]
MQNALIYDPAACTAFYMAVQARPPRFVHGTLLLLVALLSTLLVWAALTQASLVVRAPGRVRPVTTPMKVGYGGSRDVGSPSGGGRVTAVHVHEGQEVHRGEVLIQLETTRLEHERARQQGLLRAGEAELAGLEYRKIVEGRQYAAAKAKAEADLAQARNESVQAQQRQAIEVRLVELEIQQAEYDAALKRRLVARGLVARDELRKATARVHEVREKVQRARLPVDVRNIEMLQQELELLKENYAIKQTEIAMQYQVKQADVTAVRLALAKLELEYQQAAIRAPIDGIVTLGEVKVGDVIEWGKPVLEIAAQPGFRFEAVVPSEAVGHLRLGMPARIKLDAYDYQRYGTVAGTVVFISPDSGVLEGQRTVTYVVRIALAGDEVGRGAERGRIKLGMAGQGEIVTGQRSLLALFVTKIRQTISLG